MISLEKIEKDWNVSKREVEKRQKKSNCTKEFAILNIAEKKASKYFTRADLAELILPITISLLAVLTFFDTIIKIFPLHSLGLIGFGVIMIVLFLIALLFEILINFAMKIIFKRKLPWMCREEDRSVRLKSLKRFYNESISRI